MPSTSSARASPLTEWNERNSWAISGAPMRSGSLCDRIGSTVWRCSSVSTANSCHNVSASVSIDRVSASFRNSGGLTGVERQCPAQRLHDLVPFLGLQIEAHRPGRLGDDVDGAEPA